MPSRQSLLDLHDIASRHRALAEHFRRNGKTEDAESQDRVAGLVERTIADCAAELGSLSARPVDARIQHTLERL